MSNQMEILLSPEDEDLRLIKWQPNTKGYLRVTKDSVELYLHYIVLLRKTSRDPCGGELRDHINHNKCDNRRENLRYVTPKQSNENRRFTLRGASFRKDRNAWVASVRHNYQLIYCGYFKTQEEAANAAAIKRKELGFLE